MESTNLSKAKCFLYSCVTFQQIRKFKGEKKKTQWVLFTEIEKEVHYPTLERGRVEYVW